METFLYINIVTGVFILLIQALQGASQIIAEIRETHLWWSELLTPRLCWLEPGSYYLPEQKFIYELLCIAAYEFARVKIGYKLKSILCITKQITHLIHIFKVSYDTCISSLSQSSLQEQWMF